MEEDEDGHFRRPPVTEDLRQILDKYPDGGQILKVCTLRVGQKMISSLQETVQNAEDAGATEIKFVLDQRTFPRETLFTLSKDKEPLERLQVGDSWTLLITLLL